jgi:hypothetical protein
MSGPFGKAYACAWGYGPVQPGVEHEGDVVETTLFDCMGRPVCYLADDGENSVYLWSGHAVACIEDETVWGWNGRHLGFYSNGVMYDVYGRRVGSVSGSCPYIPQEEPPKPGKFAKYSKWEKGSSYMCPSFSGKYSDVPFEEFLAQGSVETR